jgi:hypothetical protein
MSILRTGGVWRIRGKRRIDFSLGGESHLLELSWQSPWRGMDFSYQLSIDGAILMDSKVCPRNWLMILIPFGMPLIILIGYAVISAHLAAPMSLRRAVYLVIPGRRAAASPESMNTGLWNMDSGSGPAGRPGMTAVT